MAGCSASLWTGTSHGPFSQRSLAPGYSVSPTQKQKVSDIYYFTWPALWTGVYTKAKGELMLINKMFQTPRTNFGQLVKI